jgi:membrane-bound lytic murein transglycosylase B
LKKSFVFILCALLVLNFAVQAATNKSFDDWLRAFKQEAQSKHGIRADVLAQAFPQGFKPIPRILELDRKQPEKTKSFTDYLKGTVNQKRIQSARQNFADNALILKQIGNNFNVDSQFVVALWGLETNFGKNTGSYEVPHALATLAFDGRRGEYFRQELIQSLKIVQEGHVKEKKFKGSWAGAMGQIQFMPTSFFKFAYDQNGDGRRDIWSTKEDIFASSANYLSKSGWKHKQPWGYEVYVPDNFDRGLIGMDNRYSNQFWNNHGLRRIDGKTLPLDLSDSGSLIQPDGKGTRAFVVYENFRTIMKWNKSVYFATSVGLLADQIKPNSVAQTDRR